MYFHLIVFFILMIPPFVILAGIRKKKSPYQIIYISVVLISIAVIGVLALARTSGMALGEQFIAAVTQLAQTIASSEDFAAKAGLADLTYNERVNFIVKMYAGMNTLLPSTIIVTSAIYTYLLYMFVSRLFRKIGKSPLELIPLRFFKWPPSLFLGYLMVSLLAMLIENIEAFRDVYVFLNVSMVFEYVIAVQGLGAVLMVLYNARAPKILTPIVSFAGIMTGLGRMVLFGVGMFDFILNPRGRVQRRK